MHLEQIGDVLESRFANHIQTLTTVTHPTGHFCSRRSIKLAIVSSHFKMDANRICHWPR